MATEQQRAWNSLPIRSRDGRQPSKLTRVQREEIVRRLAGGESPQVLALEFGVSARTVRRYRDYGVPPDSLTGG